MDINNLTIGQAKEIAKLVSCASANPCVETKSAETDNTRRKVIVRSRDAGVIYGDFVSLDGTNVTLENAVQMWKWKAVKGGTLIDCAEHGVVKSTSKFSSPSARTIVLGACAIIDVTDEAAKTFGVVGW